MTDQERAAHYLKSLRLWMPRLRWFIRTSDGAVLLRELDEREREAFPFEWDNIVGRVEKLQVLADAGALETAGRLELRGIAEELTELVPTMQRLRLRVPDLDALARAAGSPAATRPN
jgi:hypothetical protein